MIEATFCYQRGHITKFTIRGHAGWAHSGEDICCAAVSSAVQLALNAVTDAAGIPAHVEVYENCIEAAFPRDDSGFADRMMDALKSHLGALGEEFEGAIALKTREE